MNYTFFTLGLATGLVGNLFAGETLRLKLEPDRQFLLSGSPQEVVVKIDLTAAGHKKKLRRTPLNLAVVLDRSGSMTGAKKMSTVLRPALAAGGHLQLPPGRSALETGSRTAQTYGHRTRELAECPRQPRRFPLSEPIQCGARTFLPAAAPVTRTGYEYEPASCSQEAADWNVRAPLKQCR